MTGTLTTYYSTAPYKQSARGRPRPQASTNAEGLLYRTIKAALGTTATRATPATGRGVEPGPPDYRAPDNPNGPYYHIGFVLCVPRVSIAKPRL